MIEEVEELKKKVLESLKGSNVALIKATLHDIYINIDILCTYNPITKTNEEVFEEIIEEEESDYQISFGDFPPLTSVDTEETKKRNYKKSVSKESWTSKILKESEKFSKGFTAYQMADYLSNMEVESLDYLRECCTKVCFQLKASNKLGVLREGIRGYRSAIYILPKFLENEVIVDNKAN